MSRRPSITQTQQKPIVVCTVSIDDVIQHASLIKSQQPDYVVVQHPVSAQACWGVFANGVRAKLSRDEIKNKINATLFNQTELKKILDVAVVSVTSFDQACGVLESHYPDIVLAFLDKLDVILDSARTFDVVSAAIHQYAARHPEEEVAPRTSDEIEAINKLIISDSRNYLAGLLEPLLQEQKLEKSEQFPYALIEDFFVKRYAGLNKFIHFKVISANTEFKYIPVYPNVNFQLQMLAPEVTAIAANSTVTTVGFFSAKVARKLSSSHSYDSIAPPVISAPITPITTANLYFDASLAQLLQQFENICSFVKSAQIIPKGTDKQQYFRVVAATIMLQLNIVVDNNVQWNHAFWDAGILKRLSDNLSQYATPIVFQPMITAMLSVPGRLRMKDVIGRCQEIRKQLEKEAHSSMRRAMSAPQLLPRR